MRQSQEHATLSNYVSPAFICILYEAHARRLKRLIVNLQDLAPVQTLCKPVKDL